MSTAHKRGRGTEAPPKLTAAERAKFLAWLAWAEGVALKARRNAEAAASSPRKWYEDRAIEYWKHSAAALRNLAHTVKTRRR